MSIYHRRDICAHGEAFVSQLLTEPDTFGRIVVDGQGDTWEITSGDAPRAMLSQGDNFVNVFTGKYGYGFTALRVDDEGFVEVYLSGENQNDRTTVLVTTIHGSVLRSIGAAYSSNGIRYIAPDGTPVMDEDRDGPEGWFYAPGQFVNVFRVTECQGHKVGLADGGDSPAGCVVWQKPTGEVLMHQVTSDVQLPPRMAVNAKGEAAIVYSGVDSPEWFEMRWEPYRRYVAPVPVVPQPDNPRPMLRGTYSWPNLDGSNVGGHGHPLHVIDGPDEITAADEPKLLGVFYDAHYTKDTARLAADKAKCLALARRTGCAVVVYDDGHDDEAVMRMVEAEGVAVVHGLCLYPKVKIGDRLNHNRKVVVVRAIYPSDWSDTELAADLMATDNWIESMSASWLGDLFFGNGRSAPQAPKPWMLHYALDRCRRTPTPDLSNWPQTRRPEPEQPTPVEPLQGAGVGRGGTTPKFDWTKVIAALKRLFRRMK